MNTKAFIVTDCSVLGLDVIYHDGRHDHGCQINSQDS